MPKEEELEEPPVKEIKPKERKEIWKVGAVATATEPVIVNTKTDEQLSVVQALAKIMNKLEKLEDLL